VSNADVKKIDKERVLALFYNGVPTKEIVKKLKLSKCFVSAVVKNERAKIKRESEEKTTKNFGPPRRCPACGNLVITTPCKICEDRIQIKGKTFSSDDSPESDLKICLSDEVLDRYSEIRNSKETS